MAVEGAGPHERSQLRYRLSDVKNFGVDEAGVIYNLRRLDHEGSGGRYSLQVTADQRGETQWRGGLGGKRERKKEGKEREEQSSKQFTLQFSLQVTGEHRSEWVRGDEGK